MKTRSSAISPPVTGTSCPDESARRSAEAAVWRPARSPRPPEYDFDARQQLTEAVRLAEIVVSAELETEHTVGLIDAGGGDHDRRTGVLGQFASERQPVMLTKVEVKNNGIELMALQHLPRRRQRLHRGCRHPACTEILTQTRREDLIVLDDQHVRNAALIAWAHRSIPLSFLTRRS
jgi:hypothetical protein